MQVFAEYGYHGTTMKQIAAACGLSYGILYHYFSSKEKVFRFIVESSIEESLQSMDMLLAAPLSAWEKLNTFSTLLVKESLTTESSRHYLLTIQAITEGKQIDNFMKDITAKISMFYEKLAPVIKQAQDDGYVIEGDPKILAVTFFSFIQGLALLVFQQTGLESQIAPDTLLNVLRKR